MEVSFLDFLIFVILQAVLFSLVLGKYLESRGWKIYYLIIQMWKTKKGLGLIDRLAKWNKRFWRSYGGFGIILAFGFLGGLYVFRRRPVWQRVCFSALASLFILSPVFSSILLGARPGLPEMGPAYLAFFIGYGPSLGVIALQSGIDVLLKTLAGQHVMARAGPVVPGVDIKGSPFRGIPWYGWLAFPILLIVHEFSHGILARIGRIRLKSTGVILAGILPLGAFVEPDEKGLRRGKPEKTLPLFASGSTANYLTALFFFSFLALLVNPVLQVSGINDQFNHYLDYPQVVASSNPDIPSGVKIIEINGRQIRSISDIHNITSSLGPGANVTLVTDKGEIKTRLNENAMLGVYLTQDYKPLPVHLSLIYHILNFFNLVVFFNYVVGLMNLLPILPLDGGLMFKEFLWKVFRLGEKRANIIAILVSVIFGLGLLFNLLPVLLQS